MMLRMASAPFSFFRRIWSRFAAAQWRRGPVRRTSRSATESLVKSPCRGAAERWIIFQHQCLRAKWPILDRVGGGQYGPRAFEGRRDVFLNFAGVDHVRQHAQAGSRTADR